MKIICVIIQFKSLFSIHETNISVGQKSFAMLQAGTNCMKPLLFQAENLVIIKVFKSPLFFTMNSTFLSRLDQMCVLLHLLRRPIIIFTRLMHNIVTNGSRFYIRFIPCTKRTSETLLFIAVLCKIINNAGK